MNKSAGKSENKFGKILTALAVVIWLLGFGLAFVIPPTSSFVWVPDAFLLTGFWPLLCAHKCRWLWLVFGLFNFAIGFVLMVVKYMPDKDFAFDAKVLSMKVHLSQYHEPFAWMILGIISAIVGIVLIAIALITWIVRKVKDKKKLKLT